MASEALVVATRQWCHNLVWVLYVFVRGHIAMAIWRLTTATIWFGSLRPIVLDGVYGSLVRLAPLFLFS